MRAAIYARVSSAAQRDAHTIENQLRALRSFVSRQGWTVAGEYIDDGRSAKTGKLDKRESFARLVRDADAHAFDVLAIVDVDRLTRTEDLAERAAVLGPFQRAGIRIVTPGGAELDLRTMLGELYVTMQALVAAEENRKRAERIKLGKARAIAEGRKPSGPTPYGLAYSRTTGWSLHRERAAIVREMFRRIIKGDSCIDIARDFHARDVPPPRGPWSRHKVWQILRSRHPAGEWIADKRARLSMSVPAIVSESTWQGAQEALLAHGKRAIRKVKHTYLLEGLAVCSRCGSPIAIRSATVNPQRTNGNPSPAAYLCRRRKLERLSEPRCDAPILKTADVDERVWLKISAALQSPSLAAELTRRAQARDADRKGWESDVAEYRRKLARLAEIEAGNLGRHRRGLVSSEALEIELGALRRERAALQDQLRVAERAVKRQGREEDAAPETWLDALRESRSAPGPRSASASCEP